MALTWLHLSDFHVPKYDSYDRDVVLRALVSSVRSLRGDGHDPSLIFATGDIASSGKAAEYEIATQLFDDLLAATDLERKHLFVIPGNHDVDRPRGIGLARTLTSSEESDTYFAPDATVPHLKLKQEAYREWYSAYFAGIRSCAGSSVGPVETIDVDGLRVAVLPINSALFCQDENDHAKLWIGRRALDSSLTEMDGIEADIRIGLIHHPLEWLADYERANIRAALRDKIDFLLRGHLHETEIEQVVSRHGSTMTTMAAGAAYQTRRWPNRALYATVDSTSFTVFPIRYEDTPKEVWTVDPSVFPDAKDFSGVFDLSTTEPEASQDEQEELVAATAQATPAFRSNIPSTRNLPVIGRENELDEIARTCANLNQEQVLILTGTPGVGKSELAREFGRRNRARYPGGTFLVDATSGDTLVDLARIGSTFLGIEFPESLSLDEQCDRTLIELGKAPTLLIYDNASSLAAIERWLPPSGMPCHVIVTTIHEPTTPGWPLMNVHPLSTEESVVLITALAGSEVARKYGAAVAAHAGGLPVQLCPVASLLAYEERRGRTAEKHLSKLTEETHETFSIAYALLDQPERLLLHAAAGLNPQRINPKELAAALKQAAAWTDADFTVALDACRDVHLLEGDEPLRMHQLLASFIQMIEGENHG